MRTTFRRNRRATTEGLVSKSRVVLKGRHGARRVLHGFFLLGCVGLLAGACAETQGIEVGDGGGSNITPDPVAPGACSAFSGVECGDGCCSPGATCSEFATCVSADSCTEETSCSSDSRCVAGGRCLAWDTFPEGERFNRACRTNFELPSVIPEVQCSWPGENAPSEFPDSVQVISTPMVVDFDFDEDPETREPSIVFISYSDLYTTGDGILRVIDGRTCELQESIQAPSSRIGFRPQVSPALGDIDGDGRPDIVVADTEPSGAGVRSGVAAYKWSGAGTSFEELGRRPSASTALIQGFSLHDLNDDERPEILTQNTILQYDPAFMDLVEISNDIDSARAAALEPPIVCDIEGNGTAELVTAAGIFYWDSEAEEVLPKTPEPGALPYFREADAVDAQFVALADLGNFPTTIGTIGDSVEMIAIGFNGDLFVKQMDGRSILTVNAETGVGGPPVVADFDGDGKMEFASPGRTHLTVFDLDCANRAGLENERDCANPDGPNALGIAWQKPIRGADSGVAVFDFDGNNRSEVVYADQCYMRVFDGATGDVLFSVPRSSTTQWEYPVIADVDGDGKSELITTSNDNDDSIACASPDPLNDNAEVVFEKTHGVTVWRDGDDRWAGSRPIWNQHGYFVTNVNDDGTVPSMFEVQSHWNAARNPARTNTFRQNVQGTTGQSLDQPDVTTSGSPTINCLPNGTAVVNFNLCNRGIRALNSGEAAVALVETTDASNVLCNATNTMPLPSQRCTVLNCSIPASSTPFDVTIMGDYTGAIAECDENNNLSTIANVVCIGDVQ